MKRIKYLGLLSTLALAACSSTPSPDPALAAGAASVEAARAAGAPELAPVEMGSALTRLDRARALANAGQREDAIQWAEQAQADAVLARARADSERSRRALEQVQASTRSLREELARPSPGSVVPQQTPSPTTTPTR
jgi:hypothetical protein